MKININEKRSAVIATLKGANAPMTLAEISEATGMDIKSGTTNAMLAAGYIKKAGTRKIAKTIYVEVTEYAIGDTEPAAEESK